MRTETNSGDMIMSVFLSIYDFYDKRWGETALQKKIDEANARAERAHAEGMTQGRAQGRAQGIAEGIARERARWEAKSGENDAPEG